VCPSVKVGSNTSTLALRVVKDDENGTRAWGYNWVTRSPEDTNIETCSYRLGFNERASTMLRNKIIVLKSKKVQTALSNLTEKCGTTFKVGYGTKDAALSMMLRKVYPTPKI
jgi:hypothetical protein